MENGSEGENKRVIRAFFFSLILWILRVKSDEFEEIFG
jgi:hypothetical protein